MRRDLGLADPWNRILLRIVVALIRSEVLGRLCDLMLGILTCPMWLSSTRLLTVISRVAAMGVGYRWASQAARP